MNPLYNEQISQDLDSLEGILGYVLGIVAGITVGIPVLGLWLFMIFTVFSCKNPPEYGTGNYYKYHNQN